MSWLNNIVVVILCFHLGDAHEPKLNVTVYYETLCPQSYRLIQRQILPTWLKVPEYLNLTFVPYGKAFHYRNGSDGAWKFECQHGEQECYGNRIQACALQQFKHDPAKSVQYVACFMVYSNVYPFKTTCFEDYAASNATQIKSFRDCVDTKIGDDILAHYGDLTYDVTPTITYIPTITFNGVFDYDKQKRSESDLLSVVCDSIQTAKPEVCSS